MSYKVHTPGIPVRVRLVWECDGEAYVEGWARAWDTTHVHVAIEDVRTDRGSVWVKPQDVYRRTSDGPGRHPDPPQF